MSEPEWEPSPAVFVVGFQVGPGELVSLQEDGAVKLPVVGLILHESTDDERQFAFPPHVAAELCSSLKTATEQSLRMVSADPKLEAEVERLSRRERKYRRLTIAFGLAFIVLFSALQGLIQSHRYVNSGGVVEGIIGGIGSLTQIVGLCFLAFLGGTWIRRHRGKFKLFRRKSRVTLSPDAPPEESIP